MDCRLAITALESTQAASNPVAFGVTHISRCAHEKSRQEIVPWRLLS